MIVQKHYLDQKQDKNMAFRKYYIFDIKEGEDDIHGDIIILRAGRIENNMVSELPSSWDMFFFKNTTEIANRLVSLARAEQGRWTADLSEFRESRVDFEGIPRTVFYHKSLPKKKQGFWSRLFGK